MRYRRLYIPGGSYFFTMVLEDRQKKLLTEYIHELKNALTKAKNKHPFKIDAMVILPDHLHMIMTLPAEDTDFSTRLRLIKNYFSRSIEKNENVSESRKLKRERGIWQRRFWEHYISNEQDFIQHVNYIHYNPVKHKYVDNPVDWKYSSIHRYIKQGIITNSWSHR